MHQKGLFFFSLGEGRALEKNIDVPTMFQSVPMYSQSHHILTYIFWPNLNFHIWNA